MSAVLLLTACYPGGREKATMVESGEIITDTYSVIEIAPAGNTVIITLNTGISDEDAAELVNGCGLELIHNYTDLAMITASAGNMTDEQIESVIKALTEDERVTYAEHDRAADEDTGRNTQ